MKRQVIHLKQQIVINFLQLIGFPMKRLTSLLFGFLLISSLIVFGCSSSSETQQEKEATDAAAKTNTDVTTQVATEQEKAKDTIEATTKEETQAIPQTEQTPEPANTMQEMAPNMSSGSYAVQIGAFKMSETAEEIGSLAKNRFNVNVKTFLDRETGLTKVLIGSFATKDEARAFRDQIAKQFSEDYKDAWVTEIPKE